MSQFDLVFEKHQAEIGSGFISDNTLTVLLDPAGRSTDDPVAAHLLDLTRQALRGSMPIDVALREPTAEEERAQDWWRPVVDAPSRFTVWFSRDQHRYAKLVADLHPALPFTYRDWPDTVWLRNPQVVAAAVVATLHSLESMT
jgi:hypothetical protein